MTATNSPDSRPAAFAAYIERLRLLDLVEVKAISRLGRSKILEDIKAGRLKAVRFGKAPRFRPSDVEAWINSAAA